MTTQSRLYNLEKLLKVKDPLDLDMGAKFMLAAGKMDSTVPMYEETDPLYQKWLEHITRPLNEEEKRILRLHWIGYQARFSQDADRARWRRLAKKHDLFDETIWNEIKVAAHQISEARIWREEEQEISDDK